MANTTFIDDGESLEIKTKSIEKAILPLVMQISTLVSHRDRTICSERTLRVIARVGQAVNVAVDRFVTVGESIASDIPELRDDMYRACNQARAAGVTIEKLCESASEDCLRERTAVIQAAKSLLTSVTRVLLLADVVVVKQLLLAKDKVARSLGRLEGVSNFTEFVKSFSQFGSEMIELAHLTGDRQNDMKDERRRAQMAAARQVLERSTILLLTSSKTCLRHPDSSTCRENRDTVFCQMRRAMDLIHFVVKDGVFEGEMVDDWDSGKTVHSAIKQFESLVEMSRLTFVTPQTKESLSSALETIVERTQDFTDSAYTRHEHRENILVLCDKVKMELCTLQRIGITLDQTEGYSPTEELECAVQNCLTATRELQSQLFCTTQEQTSEMQNVAKTGIQLISSLTNSALACDEIRTQHHSQCFTQHMEHVIEMCKLLRHIAKTETLQVSARYTEINLRIYGPQVPVAAVALNQHPNSKIAKENLEVFCDMWQMLMNDILSICKDIIEAGQQPEKQTYMSLPRPGKHGTTNKPLKSVRLDVEEQEKIAKTGLEMKLATSEMEAETERWQDGPNGAVDENNDIVKRARNMSRMAFSMYQFTKGSGTLKTTQDLFTQAEYFAEEANRLYKIVRQFSYQVPAGAHKKELLEQLDRVPTHVQQLQFTVKNPTVGKAATFTKVDTVIHETKNLMSVISKVVTTCFVCATKYSLDLQGVGWNGSGSGSGRDDNGSRAGGDASKGGSSSSSDPGI